MQRSPLPVHANSVPTSHLLQDKRIGDDDPVSVLGCRKPPTFERMNDANLNGVGSHTSIAEQIFAPSAASLLCPGGDVANTIPA